jgi:two-component system LytT family response regulator
MLEAVIVDDETKALQSLTWELTNFSDEIEVVASFTNPLEALEYLEKKENTPDCLFLDIEMPTMDGFQFIQKLKNKDFPVVITTAYNQYAIKAMKHEAIDYLLKPIDSDDLSDTIAKIKKFNSRTITSEKLEKILLNFNATSIQKKITINTDGKLVFLQSDQILYVESDGNYSTIYLTDGHKIVLTKKLKEVNEILPSDCFYRIHNSYIINLNKIKEFIKTDGYIILDSNHKIPVSRQKKSDFLDLI